VDGGDGDDRHEQTHKQTSLLSGMARLMEKQKAEEEQRKRKLEMIGDTDDDNGDNTDTKGKKRRKKKSKFDADHQNYSNWAPPVGQTGDGKTPLNEKYGY